MEIDLSKPGASEERSKLKQFHACLNRPDLVPEQCYRPAFMHYPLVCQVNCIVALLISKNYEAVPAFIGCALREMERRPAVPAATAYFELVHLYLRQVSHVLRNYTSVSKDQLDAWIPKHVLEAGPQAAPNNPLQPIAHEDARSG
jgi:hypothetical protein